MASIYDCSIIQLPKIHNRSGNITIVENDATVPFDVRRIYYLYDVPGGETRGGHGHKELEQLIVAASGSFDLVLDDGKYKKVVTLNRPDYGVYITPGIWRDIINFSSGSICLVLASLEYNPDEYLRDYQEFLEFSK
jgi:dTDP-4-dehydrorhamnose 3,5-epimerase-like enzyme